MSGVVDGQRTQQVKDQTTNCLQILDIGSVYGLTCLGRNTLHISYRVQN